MASHNSTSTLHHRISSHLQLLGLPGGFNLPKKKKTFRSSQVLCFLWSHEPKDLTLLGPWWKTHHVPGILFAAAPKTFSYHSWRGRRVSLKFHQSIHHKRNILLQTSCPSQMLGKNLVPSQSFRNPRHYFRNAYWAGPFLHQNHQRNTAGLAEFQTYRFTDSLETRCLTVFRGKPGSRRSPWIEKVYSSLW